MHGIKVKVVVLVHTMTQDEWSVVPSVLKLGTRCT